MPSHIFTCANCSATLMLDIHDDIKNYEWNWSRHGDYTYDSKGRQRPLCSVCYSEAAIRYLEEGRELLHGKEVEI